MIQIKIVYVPTGRWRSQIGANYVYIPYWRSQCRRLTVIQVDHIGKMSLLAIDCCFCCFLNKIFQQQNYKKKKRKINKKSNPLAANGAPVFRLKPGKAKLAELFTGTQGDDENCVGGGEI